VSGRVEFLATLRAGLRGAPQPAIEDIVADYAAHFDEGRAANRTEAEIVAALGEPHLLADEHRMALRIESFESAPSVRSGAQVLSGAVALGAINTFLLCVAAPLVGLIALVLGLTAITLVAAGIWIFVAGASLELPGGLATVVLCGFGLIAAAVSLAAFLMLGGYALVNAIGRYSRLRFRLLPNASQPGLTP
jgi:uncharacterized membrane protein